MSAEEAPAQVPGDSPSGWRPRVNPWLIVLSVMPATFMQVLDTSVANVAIPHIAGGLSATPEEATWVLTSYLSSNAIILPATAWFSTVFGRKRFLLTCTLLFTLSSAACGAAPSLTLLVCARILQGAGGGALQPITLAILMESFPPTRRGTAMAVFGMGIVVAPILGPTLGGWITDNYSWRWVFYINLPVGVLAMLLVQAFIEDPPYVAKTRPRRIDFIGFALMAIGLATLQIMLDRGQEDDWFAATWVRWFAAISVVCLIAFIIRELSSEDPILDLRVLRNRNFAVGTLLITMLGIILYSMIAMLPLFLQILMGYSALLTGLTMTPRGLGSFISNLVAGWLVGIVDSRFMIATGFLVVGLSGFIFSRMNLQIAMSHVVWANFLNGVGMSMIFVTLATTSMWTLRNEQMGAAACIFNLMRNIGGSLGIAGTTTFLARGAQAHQGILVSRLTPYDPAYQRWLQTAQAALAVKVGQQAARPKALGLLYGVLLQQAQLLSFMDIFRVLAILCLLGAPLAFLFRRAKARAASAPG